MNKWDASNREQRWRDIIEHGEAILSMLQGFSYEGFEKDEMRQKAVLYDFLCVSEASARIVVLDPSVVNDHLEIPWAQIRGFGNLIRHAYGKLDMESVWEAATGGELSELIRCATAEISKTKD